MYTKCFKRDDEVIKISEYGFEWYVNDELERAGLVEDIESDIESLINEGFEEVL